MSYITYLPSEDYNHKLLEELNFSPIVKDGVVEYPLCNFVKI